MIAYHGTDAHFEAFKPWSHFGSTPSAANARLELMGRMGDGSSIRVVLLPSAGWLDAPDVDDDWLHSVIDIASEAGIIDQETCSDLLERLAWTDDPEGRAVVQDEVGQIMAEAGYIGVRYPNDFEDPGSTGYLVFDPQKVARPFFERDGGMARRAIDALREESAPEPPPRKRSP